MSEPNTPQPPLTELQQIDARASSLAAIASAATGHPSRPTPSLQKARGAAELEAEAARAEAQRGRRRLDHERELADQRSRHDEQARHLTALRALGVDLTAFLTQQRADQIIELRGDQPGTQLHLDGLRREPR